ncbi:DUF1211 domain-containing protein [Lactobacillus delbrueckii subsp. lactis]|uniref:DUF1211 domain-containing protein n=1 Tax=Lactobacillus delbrueckii subsp. lactis TaxID=29397 RepID=A0ABD4SGJ7_LACDL|nr:TMEM175 family protein [Lactobacillus delbrueckii]MCD5563591.1 DUF1211 domain-containing protein [Lactobacillus delbrueckii subsp. lactis]
MITNIKKKLARKRSLQPLSPEEQSEWDQLRQYREKAIKESGAKLAEHVMTFNDGVIAIIITIVLVEIADPLSKSAYQDFFSQIFIYLISFFVVANFWYEIHYTFSFHIMRAGKMTMVCDFAFLASLSLIPVMTKWIMGDLSVLSVVCYGIVYFLVQIFELATEIVGDAELTAAYQDLPEVLGSVFLAELHLALPAQFGLYFDIFRPSKVGDDFVSGLPNHQLCHAR